MMHNLDAMLAVEAPAGWRRVETPHGIGFAAAADIIAVGGDIQDASLVLFLSALDCGSISGTEVVERLMRRRVRQGEPARFHGTVAGRSALGFGWCDGAYETHSYFVAHEEHMVELSVSRALTPMGEPRPLLASVAEELLTGVRWRE